MLQVTLNSLWNGVWGARLEPLTLTQFGACAVNDNQTTIDFAMYENFTEMAVQFDQGKISVINMNTSSQSLVIGKESDQSTAEYNYYSFNATVQFFGFWAFESASRLQSLSLITYDTTCDPSPGLLPNGTNTRLEAEILECE